MSWREYAREVQGAGHNRHDRHISDDLTPIVPNVPIVPVSPPLDPRRALKEWHARLRVLDVHEPPAGVDSKRWAQAVDDACWIYTNFASRAVRDEWSALDLFGVHPTMPGWGGLCDRLRSARNLKMDADRAVWAWAMDRGTFCRGGTDALVSPGLVLLWETGG